MRAELPAPEEGVEPAPGGRLLHNMSQPPRSSVCIAPGRRAPEAVVFDLSREVAPGGLERFGDIVGALCDPEEVSRLGRHAAFELASGRLLDRIGFPAVAPCVDVGRAVEVSDWGLAAAVASRCSAGLFLRARTPRRDDDTMLRRCGFVDPRVLAAVARWRGEP